MKQILHIFLKDVRHYWLECAVSIALVAAFGWNEARGWMHESNLAVGVGGLFGYRFLAGFVTAMVPIAWSFVVVRVIQGESLVGDRQFWITRPYEWKKLLAAKVLFVLTFVNLPLLVLDVFLLARAAFSPVNYIIGLLWLQLMIVLYFMLPVAALATVTATVVQMLLAGLIIVLYGIGMAALSEQIPSSSFSDPADLLSGFLLVCVCLAIILLQYARSKTVTSRLLIVGFAGVLLLILVATPYRTLVAREFPQLNAGQQPPLQLALLPVERAESASAEKEQESEVEIQLPLSVSGLAAESIMAVDGVMVGIEAPDGLRWNSGWKSSGLSLFPDQKSTHIDFTLKRDVFERITPSPVKVRISLAVTLFHDANRREFVTPHGEFIMSNVGLCSAESGYFRGGIHCLTPLRRPKSLLISTDMSLSTCPPLEGESPASPGEIGRDWTRNGGSEPAEFGISPVKSLDLYVFNWNGSTSRRSAGICPGTPLVLSNPELVRRNQTSLQIDRLRLSDYRLASQRFKIGKVSIKPR